MSGLYSTAMADYPRYAIYFAPPRDSDLNRFGAGLLGYDAFSGDDLPFPDGVIAAVPDWRELTQDPRKYGFHGTLKAPFALAPGHREADLLAACARFAGKPRPVPVITPVVNPISGFIAVVPAAPSAGLNELAADCVRDFDSFRTPLTPEDRARRDPSALTPTQVAHLDRWGYPYVMDDFRFHMTLTGRIPAERREPVVTMLRSRFAALHLQTLKVDRIAVLRQDGAGARFRVLSDFGLNSAS